MVLSLSRMIEFQKSESDSHVCSLNHDVNYQLYLRGKMVSIWSAHQFQQKLFLLKKMLVDNVLLNYSTILTCGCLGFFLTKYQSLRTLNDLICLYLSVL